MLRLAMLSPSVAALIMLTFTWMTPPVKAATFTDPILGWYFHIPGDWKIEALSGGQTLSGAPGSAWSISKNPMTSVVFQVEEYDIRNQDRFATYRQQSFNGISASMQQTAQKTGAKSFSSRDEIQVGGMPFSSLLLTLQAPDRPNLQSMTLIGSIADKAVSIGIFCAGVDCDPIYQAIDSSYFSIPSGRGKVIPKPPPLPPPVKTARVVAPTWNFTIPVGWTRVASTAPDEVLVIQKGADNNLTYSLIEDENRELQTIGIASLKNELFQESLSEFQKIAHDNNLMMSSEEEVLMLGNIPFQTISIGLLDPATQTPVMMSAMLIAIVQERLAMLSIMCIDEQSCNEIQNAVEQSSFR